MFWRKYDCRKCKDTGTRKVKQILPFNELSALDQADIMVNGGYVFQWVNERCTHD